MMQYKVQDNEWAPKFQNKRFQTLQQILALDPKYNGWVIEIKERDQATDIALAQKVEQIIVTTLLNNGVNEVWVTSFSSDALNAITDNRINRMKVVNPVWGNVDNAVNEAIAQGYKGIAVELGSINAQKVAAIQAKGLKVAAFVLGTAGPTEYTKGIADGYNFMMTDVLDDMKVQNGTMPAPKFKSFKPNPGAAQCQLVVENTEVYDTRYAACTSVVSGGAPLLKFESTSLSYCQSSILARSQLAAILNLTPGGRGYYN